MKKHTKIFILLTFAILITACRGGELTVKDAWARPALAGNNSAVYFVIDNPTSEEDALLNVTSNASDLAEMHMTMVVEGDHKMDHDMENMLQGEVMTMVEQEIVPVPGRAEVTFAPGGLHVMLVGVNSDLAAGDIIELTLTFEKAGEITLQVPVEER